MHVHRRIASLVSLFAACAVGGHAAAQDGSKKVADTIEQRMVACAICHGKEGEGTGDRNYYPRLAGKPARYLYLQLVAFREGRRTYPQMVYLLRYMPDAYLQEIADYYAKLAPPYPPPSQVAMSTREIERAEQLITRGDPSKNLPACNACHGKALNGMQPAIPGLIGLHADYIISQLGAWKGNARTGVAPDCMHDIAARLSGPDIAAIAKWLASRPGMTSPPEREAAHKLPLACGGQTQ